MFSGLTIAISHYCVIKISAIYKQSVRMKRRKIPFAGLLSVFQPAHEASGVGDYVLQVLRVATEKMAPCPPEYLTN